MSRSAAGIHVSEVRVYHCSEQLFLSFHIITAKDDKQAAQNPLIIESEDHMPENIAK